MNKKQLSAYLLILLGINQLLAGQPTDVQSPVPQTSAAQTVVGKPTRFEALRNKIKKIIHEHPVVTGLSAGLVVVGLAKKAYDRFSHDHFSIDNVTGCDGWKIAITRLVDGQPQETWHANVDAYGQKTIALPQGDGIFQIDFSNSKFNQGTAWNMFTRLHIKRLHNRTLVIMPKESIKKQNGNHGCPTLLYAWDQIRVVLTEPKTFSSTFFCKIGVQSSGEELKAAAAEPCEPRVLKRKLSPEIKVSFALPTEEHSDPHSNNE